MRKFLFILIWLLSLIIVSIYTYENPEKIKKIKLYFKDEKNQVFHKRAETIVSLMTLDQELICLKKQMKQKFMNKGGKKL